ncbi:MAG: ribose-5-phosphate isomerase RpiA [Treponema sp.]|nr:ribose-5-phosphate isomerase RpiA [Treponema sp.]
MLNQDEQKVLVANTAIDTLIAEKKIFSGMKIGLGTGSTALPAVKRLADRIADGTLTDIEAVPTSFQTANYCQDLDIPVYSLNHRSIGGHLDLTIDGADAIDPQNNLIKGGGAALLREKIVAYNSTNYAIVADASKIVPDVGTKFPLPVEIVAEARQSIITALERMGATCILREGVRKCGPVITDCGNQILDCLWRHPVDPAEMEDAINGIPGVVETGFFTKKRPVVFYSTQDGRVEIRR